MSVTRQISLDLRLPSVPRLLKSSYKAANDKAFASESTQCSTLEELAEQIQTADRARLLEPTSLPKVLRGYKRRPRPHTAIISNAAQVAYERRIAGEKIDVDTVARTFFRKHEHMLDRIARRLAAG